MMSKRISFIIPLFNAEKYINECLVSILNSTLKEQEYEIIVWDDGSKDCGCDIVEQYARVYPNIHLYKNDNHGVSYARNEALAKAAGDYIWFVDADDMIVSNEVTQVITLATNSKVDMLAICWKAFDGTTYSTGIHNVPDSHAIITGKELFLRRRLMMAPWCFIYRKAFLNEHKLSFPEGFKTCEDVQFNEKALFWAKKVLTSSRIAYIYRVQANTASQGRNQLNQLLKDQIRMTWDMLWFFTKQKDTVYIIRTFSLNIRGIASFIKRIIKKK